MEKKHKLIRKEIHATNDTDAKVSNNFSYFVVYRLICIKVYT